MKPALKPQEWLGVLTMGVDWSGFKMNRHQIAAVALVEQPFGFTREDVKTLRTFRRQMLATSEEWARVKDLADRIEALLPPEGS